MISKSWIGTLLGLEDLESVESIEASFVAPWAREEPIWVLLGCAALVAISLVFYLFFQGRRRRLGLFLAGLRATSLCLLLLILAEPVLLLTSIHRPRPLLWLLFDGTESMNLRDELPARDREEIERTLELEPRPGASGSPAEAPSRREQVTALLEREDAAWLRELGQKFRVRPFRLSRADGVQALSWPSDPAAVIDPDFSESPAFETFLEELDSAGEVTALGSAFRDLARRQGRDRLGAVVVVSDFDQNTGPPALESARELGVPVHTIGVGPESAVDLQVALQAPLVMKKSERSTLVATVRQQGLSGQSVEVRLSVRDLEAGEAAGVEHVETRTVELGAEPGNVEFSYTPTRTGRFAFVAEVDRQEGEILDQNNLREREVRIRDDFLRLLFVEYEPTWEWRFIKEVFHRDKLVGTRGFRTFLRSADPRVREANPLFLPTLNLRRSKFFESDVIFIGDLPATALGERFCDMVREWVSQFGGGLVILSGPRHGPGQLVGTPLEEMLPVVLEPHARRFDGRPFEMRLSAESRQIDFMQLGASPAENEKAWKNLGPLDWYQPVVRPHPLATVLAEHPEHTCVDGETPQPLIAMRRYGKGEVVYLGFNETWRLRRKYGELYYRQFWGQMIHRLGLSHSLGVEKRFVVRSDRPVYRPDDPVTITVEAHDRDFTPLRLESTGLTALEGVLHLPRGGDRDEVPVRLSPLSDGVFEARATVWLRGEHRISVNDPVTGEVVEATFQVVDRSLEHRRATRNVALQEEIALETGGRSTGLVEAIDLPSRIEAPRTLETRVAIVPLWNTWLFFILVVVALLVEWLTRKLVHLP